MLSNSHEAGTGNHGRIPDSQILNLIHGTFNSRNFKFTEYLKQGLEKLDVIVAKRSISWSTSDLRLLYNGNVRPYFGRLQIWTDWYVVWQAYSPAASKSAPYLKIAQFAPRRVIFRLKKFVGISADFDLQVLVSPKWIRSNCVATSSLRINDIGLEKYYSALFPSSRSNTPTIPYVVWRNVKHRC